MSSQIDELELGKTLGRVEQKVDSVIVTLSAYKSDIDKEIAAHDTHIQGLLADASERRGRAIAYGSLSGFAAFLLSKAIEHGSAVLKALFS